MGFLGTEDPAYWSSAAPIVGRSERNSQLARTGRPLRPYPCQEHGRYLENYDKE